MKGHGRNPPALPVSRRVYDGVLGGWLCDTSMRRGVFSAAEDSAVSTDRSTRGGGLAPTEVGVMSKKESSRHPCFCPPHQGSCTEAPSGFKS